MRLIDADALYKKTAEWESLAMETLKVQEDNAEWQRWQTILGERTAFKHDVADAPTVDAVPVAFCDKCKHWDRDWKSDENEHYCPMIDLVTDADFFCKYGERKDGADNDCTNSGREN